MSLPALQSQEHASYESYLEKWGIKAEERPLGKGVFGRVVAIPPGDLVAKLESPRRVEPLYRNDSIANAERGIWIHYFLQKNLPHIPLQFSENRVPRQRYCSIMENAGPNLYSLFLRRDGKFLSLDEIESIAKMALETLAGMHAFKIAHLDLKPENMFRRHIGDFGSSQMAAESLTCLCISRFYRAPEVILGDLHGVEVDLWSLGCVLFELFTKKIAFDTSKNRDQSEEELNIFQIQMIRIRIREEPFFGQRTLKQILEGYNLEGDEKKAALIDLILKMIVIDPAQRITAADALKHPFFSSPFSTDVRFNLHLTGDDLEDFKRGEIRIYSQADDLLETINLKFLRRHSCFHLKKCDSYVIRYFDLDGVSEKEIRRTIENGRLELSTDLFKSQAAFSQEP